MTISQEQMADFACDIVWDCADPAHCVPVRRSTRSTAFPGKRQIDRAALRRVAALLEWHDADIVEQVGDSDGGGGPCGGGTDDDYSYGDEASYGREHRKLPRYFKDALAQARTTNLTEELIALRYYIMELENTCKQSPVTSESLNWTPAGSLFFAFTVMTTVSLPIERAQPCPTGD